MENQSELMKKLQEKDKKFVTFCEGLNEKNAKKLDAEFFFASVKEIEENIKEINEKIKNCPNEDEKKALKADRNEWVKKRSKYYKEIQNIKEKLKNNVIYDKSKGYSFNKEERFSYARILRLVTLYDKLKNSFNINGDLISQINEMHDVQEKLNNIYREIFKTDGLLEEKDAIPRKKMETESLEEYKEYVKSFFNQKEEKNVSFYDDYWYTNYQTMMNNELVKKIKENIEKQFKTYEAYCENMTENKEQDFWLSSIYVELKDNEREKKGEINKQLEENMKSLEKEGYEKNFISEMRLFSMLMELIYQYDQIKDDKTKQKEIKDLQEKINSHFNMLSYTNTNVSNKNINLFTAAKKEPDEDRINKEESSSLQPEKLEKLVNNNRQLPETMPGDSSSESKEEETMPNDEIYEPFPKELVSSPKEERPLLFANNAVPISNTKSSYAIPKEKTKEENALTDNQNQPLNEPEKLGGPLEERKAEPLIPALRDIKNYEAKRKAQEELEIKNKINERQENILAFQNKLYQAMTDISKEQEPLRAKATSRTLLTQQESFKFNVLQKQFDCYFDELKRIQQYKLEEIKDITKNINVPDKDMSIEEIYLHIINGVPYNKRMEIEPNKEDSIELETKKENVFKKAFKVIKKAPEELFKKVDKKKVFTATIFSLGFSVGLGVSTFVNNFNHETNINKKQITKEFDISSHSNQFSPLQNKAINIVNNLNVESEFNENYNIEEKEDLISFDSVFQTKMDAMVYQSEYLGADGLRSYAPYFSPDVIRVPNEFDFLNHNTGIVERAHTKEELEVFKASDCHELIGVGADDGFYKMIEIEMQKQEEMNRGR